MDLQASKIELAKIILSIENIEFIEKLKAFVIKEKEDFWDILTIPEKEEIEKGIQELNNNNRVSFNEFLKKIS